MNKLNRIFIFLALSITTIAMSMHSRHLGMPPDDRRITLEGLRRKSTEELDRDIAESSRVIRKLNIQFNQIGRRLLNTEDKATRALIMPEYFSIKNEKNWWSDYLEILRQARSKR